MRVAVIVGIGEMGGVFARALLGWGLAIVPITRTSDRALAAAESPSPEVVLVTVAEDDLGEVLRTLPAPWLSRVGLVQNELLPHVWEAHGVVDPTVAAVWFEKKPGQDVKVILPTRVAGPAAALLVSALSHLGIAAEEIAGDELAGALVVKNLYVLTANIAGIEVGGTVGDLIGRHRALMGAVAGEVLDLQEHALGRRLDRERLIADLEAAFAADPDHKTMGRAAPQRLQRAIADADEAGITVPVLSRISALA